MYVTCHVSYRDCFSFISHSSALTLTFDELKSSLAAHGINATDIACEGYSVTFLCHVQHLWSERRADELSPLACLIPCRPAFPATTASIGRGQGLQVLSNSSAVLSIEIGVNLIKYVEWGWVRSLDGKDKRESAKTLKALARFSTVKARNTYSSGHHSIAGSAAAHRAYC